MRSLRGRSGEIPRLLPAVLFLCVGMSSCSGTGTTTAPSNNPGGSGNPTPTAPGNLAANATSSSQIALSWSASTDSLGIASYLVERCQGASCSNFAQIGSTATTAYNDTTVSPSTAYSYRVRAQDVGSNFGPYSNTSSATTPAKPSGGATPTAPTNLVAIANSPSQIALSWTASTDSLGIASYLVERCQNAGCLNFAQIGSTASTSYNDTTASGSTTYSYRVRASDTGNNLGPYSNIASATTPAPTPTAPGNLTANATSSSQIALSWSASTDSLGIASYLIERCQGSSCSNFAQIATTSATSYNDNTVAASTSYSYRVRAQDTGSNLGPYSSTASATTPASSGGGSGIPTLVWSKSSANSTGVSMNSFKSNLPTSGTLTGNVLIATFQWSSGTGASAHVTDDKGDNLALLVSNDDGNQVLATYCVIPAPGARALTISFSGGMPQWVSMVNASEWYNLTCSLDGSPTHANNAAAAIPAGAIATTVDGDLIYQAAIEDNGSDTETWSDSSPWALLSAEHGVAGATTPQAAQYQVQATHGSINPTFSMTTNDFWNTVAVALKSASAGAAPPAGIRIVHMQEEGILAGEGGPFPVQFPSSGNLIISATNDGPLFDVAAISDNNHNTYTQIGSVFSDGTGQGSGDLQTFYAANATTGNNLMITYSMTGNPLGGSTFFLYDVVGAASTPYDATAGRKTATGSQSSSGSVTGPTITPSKTGELVITQIGVTTNSIVNMAPGYFAGTIPNPLPQTNNTNENNGWGFDFPAASPQTYVWSTQGGAVLSWASTAVAFMSP